VAPRVRISGAPIDNDRASERSRWVTRKKPHNRCPQDIISCEGSFTGSATVKSCRWPGRMAPGRKSPSPLNWKQEVEPSPNKRPEIGSKSTRGEKGETQDFEPDQPISRLDHNRPSCPPKTVRKAISQAILFLTYYFLWSMLGPIQDVPEDSMGTLMQGPIQRSHQLYGISPRSWERISKCDNSRHNRGFSPDSETTCAENRFPNCLR
jgi:hypothetical protein